MKHFVVGFAFNKTRDKVLLIKKKRPEWMIGRLNGIGGKIEPTDQSPLDAMHRETMEEANSVCHWELVTIFACNKGTVYFYRSFSGYDGITFEQMEDEELKIFRLDQLPDNIIPDIKWVIALCLSTVQFPVLVHQKEETK